MSFTFPSVRKGDQGAVGRTGEKGAQGEKGQAGKSGVKYVRWGRTTCPSGADIVYKGSRIITKRSLICHLKAFYVRKKYAYSKCIRENFLVKRDNIPGHCGIFFQGLELRNRILEH